MTNVVAALLGAIGARAVANLIGLDPGGPGTYRLILLAMAILLAASLVVVSRLADDRPRRVVLRHTSGRGEPARFPIEAARARARFGVVIETAAPWPASSFRGS